MKKKVTTKPSKSVEALRLKKNAVQAELELAEATAATIKDLLRRVAVLEAKSGVPGPKGDKGDPGTGFWGLF